MNKNKKMNNKKNMLEIYRKVLLGILTVLIFYPPFARGLFFSEELTIYHILSFSLLILLIIYKLFKRDYEFLKNPIDYLSLGLVIIYLLPIMFSQFASMSGAVAELLKYCNYFVIFIIIKETVKSKKELLLILNVIIASALGSILISIDGAADGSLSKVIVSIVNVIPGIHYKIFGVYVEGRMNSMLQYPNTFGVYLLSVFSISISLLMYSQKKWIKGIYGSMSFLILLTFIFTYSRGAWLLFPIICVVYLIYLWKIESVIEAFLYFVSIGIITLVSAPFFYKYLTLGDVKGIWMVVLIGVVFVFGLTYSITFINSAIKKINTKKLKIVFFSIISIFVVLTIVFSSIAFSVERPVILNHISDEEEAYKSATILVDKIEPYTDYSLKFDAQYNTQDENKWAFNFGIYSINQNNETTTIKNFTSKDIGQGNQNIDFKSLENTEMLRFTIINKYSNTNVNISNVILINNLNQKKQNVIFKYKYIPDAIADRLNSIKTYFSSDDNLRYTLNKDAFKIIKDRPIIGAGGGAWGSLYFMYQSYMYWSNQVHNYYMQFWAETGTVGIIVLMLWLIFIFRRIYIYRKNSNKENNNSKDDLLLAGLTVACISLLAHSTMDFDLTLGAVSLLLWEFVAIIMVLTQNDNNEKEKSKKAKTFEVIIMAVVCIGLLIFTFNMQSARINVQKGVQYGAEKDYEQSAYCFERAIRQYPFNSSYKINLAKLYNVFSIDKDKKQIIDNDKYIKVDQLIKESIELEPYNPEIYSQSASLCFNRGMIENGLKYLDGVIKVQPLNVENYDFQADAYLKLGLNYLNNKKYDDAEKCFNKVLDIPDVIKEINKKILRPILIADKTLEKIEKTNFLLNNYKDSESIYIFNRLLFNSYFTDTNIDNIPDSWIINNKEYKKNLVVTDNILKINGICKANLYSRYFTLEPKTIYNLSFEADGIIEEDDNFTLLISSTKGTKTQFDSKKINVSQDKKVYNYEIRTSEDLSGEQRLIICYNGKDNSNVDISNIKIYNKYIKE